MYIYNIMDVYNNNFTIISIISNYDSGWWGRSPSITNCMLPSGDKHEVTTINMLQCTCHPVWMEYFCNVFTHAGW